MHILEFFRNLGSSEHPNKAQGRGCSGMTPGPSRKWAFVEAKGQGRSEPGEQWKVCVGCWVGAGGLHDGVCVHRSGQIQPVT